MSRPDDLLLIRPDDLLTWLLTEFSSRQQVNVGSTFGAVSTAVVGRGVSLTLAILAISPAASGAAIVLDVVNINYITINLVN